MQKHVKPWHAIGSLSWGLAEKSAGVSTVPGPVAWTDNGVRNAELYWTSLNLRFFPTWFVLQCKHVQKSCVYMCIRHTCAPLFQFPFLSYFLCECPGDFFHLPRVLLLQEGWILSRTLSNDVYFQHLVCAQAPCCANIPFPATFDMRSMKVFFNMFTYMLIHIPTHIPTYIQVHIYVNMYTYTYSYTYRYTNIHIHIHRHRHVHTHIYIYTVARIDMT